MKIDINLEGENFNEVLYPNTSDTELKECCELTLKICNSSPSGINVKNFIAELIKNNRSDKEIFICITIFSNITYAQRCVAKALLKNRLG